MREGPFWTSPIADPDGIDFDLALDIADFGLGSDAPILLDMLEPLIVMEAEHGQTSGHREVLHANEQSRSGLFHGPITLRLRGKGWPEMRSGLMTESEYQNWLLALRESGIEAIELAAA